MTITLVYYDTELIIGIKGFIEQGLRHQIKLWKWAPTHAYKYQSKVEVMDNEKHSSLRTFSWKLGQSRVTGSDKHSTLLQYGINFANKQYYRPRVGSYLCQQIFAQDQKGKAGTNTVDYYNTKSNIAMTSSAVQGQASILARKYQA